MFKKTKKRSAKSSTRKRSKAKPHVRNITTKSRRKRKQSISRAKRSIVVRRKGAATKQRGTISRSRSVVPKRKSYREAIERALRIVERKTVAEGWATSVRVVRNPDRSVDGEIKILRPRGLSIADMLVDNVEDWLVVPKGVWVSAGVRYEPTDNLMSHALDPDYGKYDLLQGMVNVGTYGRRAQQKGGVFRALHDPENGIDVNMQRATHRKATEMYIRLRYSPRDEKPTRLGTTIAKRKKKRLSAKSQRKSKKHVTNKR